MDDLRIGLIGAGTLGKGLALALASRGYRVVAASSRSRSSAEALASRIPGCEAKPGPQDVADGCSLVFITTPDEAIAQVASQVSWRGGQGVIHCSGAESIDILEPASMRGALAGSFHPYQTFACLESPDEAVERLVGTSFAVEGNGWLLDVLEKLATDLGGSAIRLRPEDRAIYHASAGMSSQYLVALLKSAADMWKGMGIGEDEALSIILPLARSTLTNVSRVGIEASVTGPVVRGDVKTIQRHLEALDSRLPQLLPLYCSLCLESLHIARGKVDLKRLEAMEDLINGYVLRYITQSRDS